MKTINVLMIALIMVFAPLLRAKSNKSCGKFEKVDFSPASITVKNADGSEIKDYAIRRAEVGSYLLDAGDTPSIILNKKTGKSCKADAEIVSGDSGDVYWLKNANKVLYRSYSGSE